MLQQTRSKTRQRTMRTQKQTRATRTCMDLTKATQSMMKELTKLSKQKSLLRNRLADTRDLIGKLDGFQTRMLRTSKVLEIEAQDIVTGQSGLKEKIDDMERRLKGTKFNTYSSNKFKKTQIEQCDALVCNSV